MATLNPLGIFVLYFAMMVAPSSSQEVTIHFSEFNRWILVRSSETTWFREDDLGNKIYFRCEKTKLISKMENGNEEITDLGDFFELTGKEDWTQSRTIRSKQKDKPNLQTVPEKNKFIVTAEDHEVVITW